ncbi:MAG: hypothetical protein HY749_16095 [Gammaproteobacteria bacterium]|nr:hypothetical protein [Gammaproteobacteria bacterium]
MKLGPVAEAARVDESQVSRWKSTLFPQMAAALAAAGLKVVPIEQKLYREDEVEALRVLATRRLETIDHASKLEDGE